MKTLKEFALSGKLLVVAHRGSSGTAPENTLAAVNEALQAGAGMIEIDVQFTADDKAIVFHDPVLGRTTDGTGKVRKINSSDLGTFDAGSWFDPRFRDERIPFLLDILSILKEKVYINIEIKPPQPDENYTARIHKIATIIQETDLAPYTLFSSFHYPSLIHLKSLSARFHTAAIHIPGDPRLPSEIVREVGSEAFVCALKDYTVRRSEDAGTHRIPVGVYTVNSADELRLALRRNVRAIVTNFPAKIIAELDQYPGIAGSPS